MPAKKHGRFLRPIRLLTNTIRLSANILIASTDVLIVLADRIRKPMIKILPFAQ